MGVRLLISNLSKFIKEMVVMDYKGSIPTKFLAKPWRNISKIALKIALFYSQTMSWEGCASLRRRRTVRYFYDVARSFFSKNGGRKRRFVSLKTPFSRGKRRFANFENGVFFKRQNGKTAKRRFQKKFFLWFWPKRQNGETALSNMPGYRRYFFLKTLYVLHYTSYVLHYTFYF